MTAACDKTRLSNSGTGSKNERKEKEVTIPQLPSSRVSVARRPSSRPQLLKVLTLPTTTIQGTNSLLENN